MGLFNRLPRNGLRGTAHVVSTTGHNGRAAYQRCRLNLVVQVEGIPAYSVEHSQICPASKWPRPGTTVPVVVSRKNQQKLKIDFDAMPDQAEVARQMAEQQAAMLRNGGGTALPPNVTIVGGTMADIPPQMRAGLEQMLGADLDGDGTIGA